jgi:hypothetical protein
MSGWLTAELEYEGFPLMLRRPATVDRERLQQMCCDLLTVTHRFSDRKPNGLPQPDYNNGLFALDLAVQRAFNESPDGAIVLIETFGGERNYYFYVSNSVPVADRVDAIRRDFPGEAVDYSQRPDPDWTFIDKYARDYF